MTPKDRFLEMTASLLERQGYHATGLNQIVAECKAPKGSMYHYFPKGKEQLAALAVETTGQRVIEDTEAVLARYRNPAESVRQLVLGLASHVEKKDFRGGNPISLVALEVSASPQEFKLLSRTVGSVYQSLVDVVELHLQKAGISSERVPGLATTIVAAIEGAMILARTRRSVEPLRHVAEELYRLLQQQKA